MTVSGQWEFNRSGNLYGPANKMSVPEYSKWNQSVSNYISNGRPGPHDTFGVDLNSNEFAFSAGNPSGNTQSYYSPGLNIYSGGCCSGHGAGNFFGQNAGSVGLMQTMASFNVGFGMMNNYIAGIQNQRFQMQQAERTMNMQERYQNFQMGVAKQEQEHRKFNNDLQELLALAVVTKKIEEMMA